MMSAGLGFQIGSTKGIFMDFGGGGSANPNFTADQIFAGLGYNLKLPINNLVLQPEIIFNQTERHISFNNEIQFDKAENIIANGKYFRYKCNCSVSGPINSTIINKVNSLDFRLSLKYNLTKYVAVRIGADYWQQLNSKSYLRLYTRHDSYEIHNAVQEGVENSGPLKRIYNIKGYSWTTSLIFGFKMPPPSRSTSGGTYHYFHSHSFHSFSHSCH